MRIITILTLISVMISGTLQAQKAKTKPKTTPVNKVVPAEKGTLSFDRTNFEIGTVIDSKEPIYLTFKFKNVGKGAISITDVKTDCDCSKADWIKTPVAADKEGQIEIRFFPALQSGKVTKKFTVFTDGSPSVYYLSMTGNVDDRNARLYQYYPEVQGNTRLAMNNVRFDTLYINQTDSAFVNMFNPTFKDINIKSIKAPEYITATPDQFILYADNGTTFTIKVNGALAKDYGKRTDEILINTDDPKSPIKKIFVKVNLLENFSIQPPKFLQKPPVFKALTPVVNIDTMQINTVKQATFYVTNTGKSPMFIRKIYSDCGCVTTNFDYNKAIKRNKKVAITIQFDAKYDIGEVTKEIIVITNTPDRVENKLNLKANIIYIRK